MAENKEKIVDKKQKLSKQKKEKKPNKLARTLKETGSELKKVIWPKAGKVVKQTGVVLLIVAIFTLVIFGMDRLFGWLYQLLISAVS